MYQLGLVSADEILNLETYNELNFLATNQKYQNQTELKKEAEISRILNQWIDNKNEQTISNTS